MSNGSEEVKPAPRNTLEENINLDVGVMLKMQLKVAFDEVDGDGGGDLDQEEFVEAFADILGNMSKTALRQMFMKIDANADGRVD
eukprot:gene3887-4848_t